MRRPLIGASAAVVAAVVVAGGVALAATSSPPCTANTDACRQTRIAAVEAGVASLDARLGGVAATVTVTATPTVPPTQTASPSVTAVPTSSPTSTATPPPSTPAPTVTQPVSGFPNESNTGVPAGVTLTASGSISVFTDGAVIDAKDINGSVYVAANNVTIKRSRIRHPGGMAIMLDNTKGGLLVEDVEIDGTGNSDGSSAIGYARFTLRRVNIHNFGEGPSANGDVVVEDSYMHDFTNFISRGAHQDGIQAEWGDDMTFRHNTILMNVDGANSAIWVSAGNPHSNVVIENNLLAGASSTVGLGDQAKAIGNHISTMFYPRGGYFGPFTYGGGKAVQSGNVWHETGQPIN